MKTSSIRFTPRTSDNRGGALLIVVLLCTVTLVVVGSYLNALSTQSKLSYRTTLVSESRNAAEGVAEYALAEIYRRAKANPSFGAGANPNLLSGFVLTPENKNFIGAAGGANMNHLVSSSIETKNSVLSDNPATASVISSLDPVNKQNPTSEKAIQSIRSMEVFAKASVRDPRTNQVTTSYISENVQIADETWLNYAIFYNMDLEFHAGPDFTIYGPVHCNRNIYATTGATLKFYSSLSAVGSIFRYDKYTGNYNDHNGNVYCSSKTGMLDANLKTMSGVVGASTVEDSRRPDFKTYAPARWDVFVKDSSLDVKEFAPNGMQRYIPEDYTTDTWELRNNAYLMIEPQLSSNPAHIDPITGIAGNDYGNKGEGLENVKFSSLSGFVIQILPPNLVGTTADFVDLTDPANPVYKHHAPQWQLVCYRATDSTKSLNADNHPVRDADGLPIIDWKINPFTDKDEVDYPAVGAADIKRALKVALLNAIVAIPYKDGGTTGAVWGNGTSALSQYTQKLPLRITDGAAANDPGPAPTDTTKLNIAGYYPIYDQREAHDYTTAGGDVTLPMKGAMHVLKIDVAKLKTLLTDTTGLWLKPGSASYVYNPATNFTGVVYVQLPLKEPDALIKNRFPVEDPVTFGGTGPGDGDRVRPPVAPIAISAGTPDIPEAADIPAVADIPYRAPVAYKAPTYYKNGKLKTAEVLAVPGQAFVAGHPLIPGHPAIPGTAATAGTPGYAVLLANATEVPKLATANPPDGFTVATNGPLYVWGSYNCDGLSNTGSATTPDAASELPAMLAADSITVLSPDFTFPNMATTVGSASNFTEISASLITGLVPTRPGKDQIWAGGVHNLVRLLQNWSGTYRYRGSIAVLFECEVAKGAYHEGHNPFYSPPTRQIGYHDFLKKGRFPPATPINRTVRRMNLKDITKAQYDAGPSKPPAYNQ